MVGPARYSGRAPRGSRPGGAVSESTARINWAIASSLIVAFMLSTLPMPSWAAVGRPSWVALVLVYWCIAMPIQVGVIVAWAMGLLLDVMSGTLLGQHALGLSVLALIVHQRHQWLRALPLWQQGISVFVLMFGYQVIVLWINGIRGFPVMASAYWAAPLVSTLLWPWIYFVLRDLRRKCVTD